MTITIRMSVSEVSKSETVDLEELGFDDEDAWKAASDEEKSKAVRDFVFALPEQPYWMDDSYEEDYP